MFARFAGFGGSVRPAFLHVFPFIPSDAGRADAAGIREVIKERAKRLRATGEAALQKRLASE